MTASDVALPTRPHGAIVFRRLVARVIDDGLLIGLSIVVVTLTNHVAGSHAFSMEGSETVLPGTIGGHHALLLIGTAALIVALFIVYAATAALTDGRTPGRAAARLRIVTTNGSPAPPATIFGRELLRVATILLGLALLVPAAQAIQSPVTGLGSTNSARNASAMLLIDNLLITLLPITVIAGTWIGLALVDPDGRTPHDRLAKTKVIERTT